MDNAYGIIIRKYTAGTKNGNHALLVSGQNYVDIAIIKCSYKI